MACLLFGGNLGELKNSNQGFKPFAELLLQEAVNIYSVADFKIWLCDIENVVIIFF